MKAKEAELILEACLNIVNEQYVTPLMMALGTLTVVACRDPETAQAVAEALQMQADSCPDDVSGKILLQSLVRLAAAPAPADPASVQDALRASLRLIQGGNQSKKPKGD